MEASELKPFEELHHANKLIRLDWFGGVKWNVNEHDNPLVECIFTQVDDPDPSTGTLRKLSQFIAGIAVGYLPTLYSGQFFQNGKQLPINRWPEQPDWIIFELDLSNLSAVSECLLPDILNPDPRFMGKRFLDAANRSGIKKLVGSITRSSNEKTNIKIKHCNGSLPQQVVIHEMELIRFYLTNSSHSSKNLFNGDFSDDRRCKRVINELHELKSLDPVTGAGRFVYRHGYRNDDAPILGRILLDPTGHALKAAQRVHNTIVADRINSDEIWLGYPRTYFPFRGKTTLKLSGRYLKTPKGYVFFANRILSCSAPFPYKSLSYCDDTQPGGKPAPFDAPIAFEKGKVVATGDEDSDPLIGESKSNEPPSAASQELRVELGKREYVALLGMSIKRVKLRDSTYRSGNNVIPEKEGLINASTGAVTSGESTARKQSITEKIIIPSAVTADLSAFISAIIKLQETKKSWEFTPILVGDGPENESEQTSYFPEEPCEKKKNVLRQFSYTDEEKKLRRRFICVQIVVNERYMYVFEAQRRLRNPIPDPGISPYKENLPILLLHTPGYEEMSGEDFIEIIRQTVIQKNWPKDGLGILIREDQAHGQGHTVDDLCGRVSQLVWRTLYGLPPI